MEIRYFNGSHPLGKLTTCPPLFNMEALGVFKGLFDNHWHIPSSIDHGSISMNLKNNWISYQGNSFKIMEVQKKKLTFSDHLQGSLQMCFVEFFLVQIEPSTSIIATPQTAFCRRRPKAFQTFNATKRSHDLEPSTSALSEYQKRLWYIHKNKIPYLNFIIILSKKKHPKKNQFKTNWPPKWPKRLSKFCDVHTVLLGTTDGQGLGGSDWWIERWARSQRKTAYES